MRRAGYHERLDNWLRDRFDPGCVGRGRGRRSWDRLAYPLRDLGEFAAKPCNLTGQVRDFIAIFIGAFFKLLVGIRGSNQSDDGDDRSPE